MKKVFIVLALLVMSCEQQKSKPWVKEKGNVLNRGDNEISTIFYQGHDYILFTGFYKGSLCHSESCKCKTLTKSK